MRVARMVGVVGLAIVISDQPCPGQRLTPLELYDAKNRSVELVQSANVDSALALLRRIAPLDSTDAYLWRRYARVAATKRQYVEAARAFEHAYYLGVFGPALTSVDIARQYANAGRLSLALDWLERAARHALPRLQNLSTDTSFVQLRDSVRFKALYTRGDTARATRAKRWAADLDFFLREAQRMHVHPERPAFSRGFIDTIAALKSRIANSTDLQMIAGLRRASAMLRDGHSGLAVEPKNGMRSLPIDLYIFSDGVFVIRGLAGHEKWVGHKVMAIGNRPIAAVLKAAAAYVPHDNPVGLLAWLPAAMTAVPYLQEMGLADGEGNVTITLQDGRGEQTSVRLPPGEFRGVEGLLPPQLPGVAVPLYLRNRDSLFWFTELPAAQALFVGFNGVGNSAKETLEAFSRRLIEQLRNPGIRNLIVDVRNNGGGNSFLLPPLIQAVTHFAAEDTAHKLFVLTGRHTFSAAQNFVSKLEWLLNVTFAGEPTGSSPNFTGESTPTLLPYSGLRVVISNRVHMNSDWEDRRLWISPQLAVPLSSEQYFRGEDPVLEAVIALIQRKPRT